MRNLAYRLIKGIKHSLYFIIAGYFGFFARIYLRRWHPKIITVTGSSGKTTLLHLFEAQLGDQACYSHKANSAFGIPFNILGLDRKTFHAYEWILFAMLAPIAAWRAVRPQSIYVTEVDAERPGEANFLSKILKPDVLIWLSLEEAHGVQYDALVPALEHQDGAARLDALKVIIAREFGWLLERTRTFAVLSEDNQYIAEQAERTKAKIHWIRKEDVQVKTIGRDCVTFAMQDTELTLPHLVPPDAGESAFAVAQAIKALGLPFDPSFSAFMLPPGRSSVFAGQRGTTLIDSSYNATMDGMRTMLSLFKQYPVIDGKWLVLGDMIEQGESEEYEHTLLAKLIADVRPDRVVFVGPRLARYTKPALEKLMPSLVIMDYDKPWDAYGYLVEELHGNETILFKGARFLEGIVERLLLNPSDAVKLCRREKIWVERRKAWGI